MNNNNTTKYKYIDREKSWLSFNERVLQEAGDETVPLLERLRFIGIFSNNLDEFFRVRYATIRRMTLTGESNRRLGSGVIVKDLLAQITERVIQLQKESVRILHEVERKLEDEGIFMVNEKEISEKQQAFVKDFFLHQVSPDLVTIILSDLAEFPLLRDTHGYLVVKLEVDEKLVEKHCTNKQRRDNSSVRYAIIEIPNIINRFVEVPSEDPGKKYIMMLDDIIRYNLDSIFNIFDLKAESAYMIKVTRDAELDFDTDLHKSFVEKISSGVRDRKQGAIVRFVYDQEMDDELLDFLLENVEIELNDSIIPSGRYHNRRDYMGFPTTGRVDLTYPKQIPVAVKGLSLEDSIIQQIQKRDYMIYTPYQSYSYLVKFLREAALDPQVLSIKITLYRLAKNSQIISSLINAVKNGKKVIAQVELQARFDEASNIYYSELMQAEGVQLIFGVKGLKVHSKICVVERLENKKVKRYGFVSTGNFNESTAKVYTDVTVFTSHNSLMKDVSKVFEFLQVNYRVHRYKHLLVSPHYTRKGFYKLIEREIKNAKNGLPAYIRLKMNSLSDLKMIDKLYEASNAGVKIQLIIRGICSLIPGVPGMSENIEAISIVDRFLEHSRVYIFGNNDNPEVFISSADFMTRNLDERVEVTCPIYDDLVKQELIDTFDIGWKGNYKTRYQTADLSNKYRGYTAENMFHAQQEMYKYYQNKLK
ncbi:polyphosphate kinase 1 [Myroides odoratimimus]|uniref:Polyphosphate kinase n=1 Tax=Myroides odoratimimus CIP 101113 TaxID=883154 RepID=A0AAV3F263_9FLAO|nr:MULTISPECIES: polyphosphate kinase 1 [Myroides]AJA70252.1 polyphosphate kinase 1 [Myroides sp. A21]EHO11402.1 polyphosphate kinase 1 [Myroides odoratimimus CIP 101113]MDM1514328.1 polyphosphate kinase 1 [Myroides odoratimimus]MDM1517267.1 polyphosphate kinase 1 [Myroides odoratimimus]MDM1530150.1 polyphosphate kinase 1 [Myroides odoratimimus]